MISQPYRNDPYARFLTKPNHLPLFLPIKQVPSILHTNELGPAIPLGAELHHSKLICPHTAGTYVVHFPAFYQIVKCFHRFFNRHCFVEAVDLQEIDIGGLKTGERRFHGSENALARET